MSWLLSLLSPLLEKLLSLGIKDIIEAIKLWSEERAKAKEREAAIKLAESQVLTKPIPGETEEERLKRQEDEWKNSQANLNKP